MPSFVRLDLRDDLVCNGGVRLASLQARELASATDVRAIDEQESLTITFARILKDGSDNPFFTAMVMHSVVVVVWDDGAFDEWRVASLVSSRGADGLVAVTCNPISNDLGDGADSSTGKGYVSVVDGPFRTFDFAVGDVTPEDILTDHVLPACPSWATVGTVDPTLNLPSLSWNRLTPWALALLVRDTCRAAGASCELQLRRNGTSGYAIDLVTQIGASAAVPLLHARTALRALTKTSAITDQASRLFVAGGQDPDGQVGTLGRAQWRVVSVVGQIVTLADQNGGAGPIAFDGQWVGAYLLRLASGRTFAVLQSSADDSSITVLSPGALTAGDRVEFRLTEPGNNVRSLGRFPISAVTSSTLTVSGWTHGSMAPLVEWYARVWDSPTDGFLVLTERITAASSPTVTVGATTGATTSYYCEFVQLDGSGEVPTYLEHPAAIAAYGRVKVGDLAVPSALGVTNFVPNSWCRAFTAPTAMPDGWADVGAAIRNYIRIGTPDDTHGPYSFLFAVTPITAVLDIKMFPPIARIPWAMGASRVSARIRFTASLAGTGDFSLAVYSVDGDGNLDTEIAATTVPTQTLIDADAAWMTVDLVGVDLEAAECWNGVAVVVHIKDYTNMTLLIDYIALYPFSAVPDDAFEFGDASVLWQSGNKRLAQYGFAPVAFDVTLRDLERIDPTAWSANALVLGGSVRVFDAESNTDQTVRMLRRQRDLLRPDATQLQLATGTSRLARLVAVR